MMDLSNDIRLCRADENSIPFLIHCIDVSFPADERRCHDSFQKVLQDPLFRPYVIQTDNTNIGILTSWSFDGFVFIEHFAIMPSLRGHGAGRRALGAFLRDVSPLPVILEAELPETDLAQRRIRFYESCGLSLLDVGYEQPPYEKDGHSVPMKLMTTAQPTDPVADRFISLSRNTVYRFR